MKAQEAFYMRYVLDAYIDWQELGLYERLWKLTSSFDVSPLGSLAHEEIPGSPAQSLLPVNCDLEEMMRKIERNL